MKANRGLRTLPVLAAALVAMLAASCAPQIIPPPAPAPAPTPRPTPRPSPPPPSPQPSDWREAPITPGDWTWSLEGGQSVARFAGGALILRCDRPAGTVTLLRAGATLDPQPMTITTSSGQRTLTATPQGQALVVTLPAGDPVLDAMAFSRGRFMLEVSGAATLYVPSWPEISRVIEDCR